MIKIFISFIRIHWQNMPFKSASLLGAPTLVYNRSASSVSRSVTLTFDDPPGAPISLVGFFYPRRVAFNSRIQWNTWWSLGFGYCGGSIVP